MPNDELGKNVVIFGVDNSSLMCVDKIKNVVGEGPTDELVDDTTITREAKCSINISNSRKEICLSLHYNGKNVLMVLILINLKLKTVK